MKFQSNTPEETEAFAKIIGEVAKSGDVIVLSGDLGAGKTTLTKGIAIGLGISQTIKSPTYTIIREYQEGKLPLYHMDVYRIGNEAGDLGLDEYFDGDGVTVVEWGELLETFLPVSYLKVRLAKDSKNTEKRWISIEAVGENACQFQQRIKKQWGDENEGYRSNN